MAPRPISRTILYRPIRSIQFLVLHVGALSGGRGLHSSPWQAEACITSVRHRINNVVHADPHGQIGEFGGVPRVVSVFPRVANIGVVRDGYENPPLVVVDRPPVRAPAAGLRIFGAVAEVRTAW